MDFAIMQFLHQRGISLVELIVFIEIVALAVIGMVRGSFNSLPALMHGEHEHV